MSITIKTYTTPSKSRSGNGGSSSVQGSSTIINGGSSVDIVKELDTTTLADINVLSSKRVIKEITDRGHTHANKELLDKIDQDLSKSADVIHNSFKTKDFVAGITGKGAKIDENGSGEMESLSLRKFLEVPELRYNRISIQVGNQWRAPGGGIIDSVTLDNNGLTGLAKLHLEDGEIGKIAVDDICMGIYHDGMTLSNNEASDYDDGAGNFKFSGFFSAYFRITEITDTIHNSAFKFSVRQTSDSWSKTFAPCAAMHFVCYGNFSDTTRQSSRYSTLKYERYLSGVNTWEFGERNIMAQFGDLSNLTAGGISMSGYSAYLNRIYMSGNIKQFEDIPDWMDVEQSRNGHMDVGQSEVVTIVIRDGYNRDVTSLYPNISLTRESGDEASDTSWNASHSGVGNPFTISFSDLAFTEERLSTLFNVKARKQDGKETNGAFNYSN